ncbi:CHAT domain-containing protein [Marixanthomonas spongiae]|uniref:CHAT domain-containing protein n=1 Tax=Marixanthomonas spongiae TaxID=2174845 RepID=A0A2U0I595_9FLAO|nr:CHAT domain-containing protein [Marixanthomonas spongiae]PVW16278.1 hypothetical protein DDV96_03140 [Marixanthomonas spongiae]
MKKILFIVLLALSGAMLAQNTVSSEIIQKADSLLKQKEYLRAAQHWETAIQHTSKKDPSYSLYSSKLFFTKGKISEQEGDYPTAVTYYNSAQKALNDHTSPVAPEYVIDTYNGLYHALAYAGKWEMALVKGNEGLAFFTEKVNKETQADYIYDLAYINDRLKNHTEAIALYQQAIDKYKELKTNKNFDLGLAYQNLATVYSTIGFFSERLKSFEQARSYWEKDTEINPSYLITLYGNLLKLYIEYGDTAKAEALFTALNQIPNNTLQTADIASKFRLKVMYNAFLGQLTETEMQQRYFNAFFSSLPLHEKNQYSNHYLAALLELADLYIAQEVDQLANKTLSSALTVSKRYHKPFYEMSVYSKQAKLAIGKNDDTAALDYLNMALAIDEIEPIGLVNVANILIKKANLQTKRKRFAEANAALKKALSALAEKQIDRPEAITVKTFEKQHSSFFIMALKDAAGVYKELYNSTQQKDYAKNARYLYSLAAEVFGLYYQNGEYNTDLDHFNKSINEGIYEMHTALGLSLSDTVIERVQANNSQVLRNEFERKYTQFLAVDQSLLSQRNVLQFKIKHLQDSKTGKGKRQQLQDSLKTLDREIAAKAPLLQSFYQNVYQLKNIKQHISKDELLINYFMGYEYSYAIAISKNDVHLYRLAKTDTLKETLNAFYNALQNPQKNVLPQARQLYKSLILPLEDKLTTYKTLTIIPDDYLHYLPFEVLEREKGPLLTTHTIQYANTVALWYFLKEHPYQSKADKDLLVAFAPQYTSTEDKGQNLRGSRFQEIEGARQEAETITTTFGGDLFLGDEATIENFITHSSTYKIYHLAMHAVLNEQEHYKSSLIFNGNDPFDFSSLYGLYFPADLVVLSACNTGVGKLASGEGLLSLSRALTYSGARSSVYSLWEVPDKETAEIMASFYRYLQTGENKATALANAKRDFKQNNPMKGHPYYWAGFVIAGDTVPILAKNNTLQGLLLVTGVAVCLGVFLYRRKKQVKSSI